MNTYAKLLRFELIARENSKTTGENFSELFRPTIVAIQHWNFKLKTIFMKNQKFLEKKKKITTYNKPKKTKNT